MKKSLNYLDQLIEVEKMKDAEFKRDERKKGVTQTGESWILHQLKVLREVIMEESQ